MKSRPVLSALALPSLTASVLLLAAGLAQGDKSAPPPKKEGERRVGKFTVQDLKGQPVTLDSWKGHKFVVLLFLGTECPVSNGFSPAMGRLAKEYTKKGVAFYGVHPDPDVTADAARKHAKDFSLNFPMLLDPYQTLATQTGVDVVPEAVVLAPGGKVLYRGRINDLFAPNGRRLIEARNHDLQNAIDAVLAGKAAPPPGGTTYGCPLPPPAEKK
jgi:peroxiredoxin